MIDTVSASIRARITRVYGAERAEEICTAIGALLERYSGNIPARRAGWSERDALLITYADSVVGQQSPLQELRQVLRDTVGQHISFVHLLPFFPFSSDDGFAVEDFRVVRPDLGTWDDLQEFANDYRLVYDAVINHVSASSGYMKGYCAGDPEYADFFIALDPDTDTSSVLRTRNLPLLHDYETTDGIKWLWTTFSRDQLDLNYDNPRVLLEILDVMLFYALKGASMVRLDAIPYMWKELGTSCAHLPQTHELIKLIRDVYDEVAPHVLVLTETNVPHKENVVYFGEKGDEAQLIYNFTLAPLILWSLVKGDAATLTEWAQGIDWVSDHATYLNITATHDGIGMRPTEGILSEEARMEMVQLAYDHHGDMTGKRNSDGSVSPYELNLNYFDAVNHPDSDEPLELQIKRFMVSQAIPMALMGMPGIYVHSLFGSRNDTEGVARTGRARSINREQLHADALREELANPDSLRARVLSEMLRLLDIRGKQAAFHPDARQQILDLGPSCFALRRQAPETGAAIVAVHNMTDAPLTCTADALGITTPCTDLLSEEPVTEATIELAPYQVRWLTNDR